MPYVIAGCVVLILGGMAIAFIFGIYSMIRALINVLKE